MYKLFICITILLFNTIVLFSIDFTDKWIEDNPNPSKQILLSFVNTHYSSIDNIQDTYDFFYTILEYYPPSLIHYSIYTNFAKIAILRYDFQNAALLYYSAFEITNFPEHLLLASIQEYQAGNIALVKQNILILQEKYDISNIIIPLITLNIVVYMYEKKYTSALEYIQNTLEKNKDILFPASIYYLMYKVSLKTNNKESKAYALSLLQEKYTNTLEYQLIQNTVYSLPIPSHFFSFLDLEIDIDTALNNKKYKDIPLSVSPELGYQVSSFQNKERANNYYYKLTQLLSDSMLDEQSPIISTSIVQGLTFYQIIIPLSKDKDLQSQIKILRKIGIEGFLKHNEN